jgi:hypothetical protein
MSALNVARLVNLACFTTSFSLLELKLPFAVASVPACLLARPAASPAGRCYVLPAWLDHKSCCVVIQGLVMCKGIVGTQGA